jgi:hypothetical protein
MSILLVPQEDDNWIHDKRLSWAARGILLYAITSGMESVVARQLEAVPTAGRAGRDKIRSLLTELIRYGYLIERRDDGESLRLMKEKWRMLREFIFDRDHYTCQYCGATEGPLHLDHVIPIARGGTNDPNNLTTACETCNTSKGSKLPDEWRIAPA